MVKYIYIVFFNFIFSELYSQKIFEDSNVVVMHLIRDDCVVFVIENKSMFDLVFSDNYFVNSVNDKKVNSSFLLSNLNDFPPSPPKHFPQLFKIISPKDNFLLYDCPPSLINNKIDSSFSFNVSFDYFILNQGVFLNEYSIKTYEVKEYFQRINAQHVVVSALKF